MKEAAITRKVIAVADMERAVIMKVGNAANEAVITLIGAAYWSAELLTY